MTTPNHREPEPESKSERVPGSVLPMPVREALRSGKVPDSRGTLHAMDSNVSESEAESLYRAVRSIGPEHTAEVGLACGISASAIAQALSDAGRGLHHVMDPFQDRFHNLGLTMLERSGLLRCVDFHQKFAEEIFPSLPPLQFVFIDASHLFDLTLAEFVLADKKLPRGGIVAFHDMWMPSQQKLLRYILSNRSYEIAREFDAPNVSAAPRRRWRDSIRELIKGRSWSARLFRPEFLRPWADFGIPNLVFLRKLEEDKRDWRFHVEF